MFTRTVRMNLKPGSKSGFTKAIDNEVFPKLKKFAGFSGQISMVSPDGKEAVGISIWDRREDAEAYNRKGYPDILKVLERFTEGKIEVHTYDLTNWTIEKLTARKAA